MSSNNGNLLYTLIGHEDSVVTLGMTTQGELISGSWDKTVRVWRGTDCVEILKGHTHAVWCVLGLPSGDILSGSADKSIKVWRKGQCIQTLTKHRDCVRSLSLVPNIGFLSAGNDGTILLWSFQYQLLQEYNNSHDAFIYSVGVLSMSGQFVSASEDQSIRIWQGIKFFIIFPSNFKTLIR